MEPHKKPSRNTTNGHPVGVSKLGEFAERGGVKSDADFMDFLNAILVDRIQGHADHDMAMDLTHGAREMRVFAVQKQTFSLRFARVKGTSDAPFALIEAGSKTGSKRK